MGKKVIIALYGLANTGKTTTLRKLSRIFLELIEEKDDFQVVFDYEHTKIAISTGGDDKGIFEEDTRLYDGTNWKPRIFATPKRVSDILDFINPEDNKKKISTLHELSPQLQNPDTVATALRKLSREFLKLIEEKENETGDIQIAFCYRGKKIVISTAGDDKKTVTESTNLFKALEADILVTATRSERSNSHKELKQYKEDTIEIGKDAIWIHSSGALLSEIHRKYQELIDEGLAKTIKSIIDQVITDSEKE
jgi:hypothetical protein